MTQPWPDSDVCADDLLRVAIDAREKVEQS